ncbi:MAG: heavy metal translocating P-type ATPase [Actinomycetota bacterium]
METVLLDIEGMTCSSCVAHVEKALKDQDGVQDASVNLATERATVNASDVSLEQLIHAVEAAGYHARVHADERASETDRPERRLLNRFIVAATLSVPAMVLSMGFGAHRSAQIASGILIAPVVFFSGWIFIRNAIRYAVHAQATMDTLVAVGTLTAFGYSVWSVVTRTGEPYFETAGAIITLILLGKYFESSSRARASSAIKALAQRGAKDAMVLRDGVEVRVPIVELHAGDRFVVRPGEKIATDGVVIEGASDVDASLVTGESVPTPVHPGDAVIGGTLNTQGLLLVEATKVGSETTLAQIAKLVEQAQTSKAPIQRLADRVAGVFVPVIIAIAIGTFIAWIASGHTLGHSLVPAIAVLIIACPCAMGLATPAAIMVGTGRGASMGVLIRGGEVLEGSRRIDTVVLDKTGTITSGKMRVTRVMTDPWNGGSVPEDEVLRMAAAVEQGSEHPIARAIVQAARERSLVLPSPQAFHSEPGLGASAAIELRKVVVGRPALLGSQSMMSCTELDEQRTTIEGQGETVVLVGWSGRVRGLIAIADELKPTSRQAIDALRELGCDVTMLTGDNRATAEAIASRAGIQSFKSELAPADKVEAVRALQDAGHVVAFVGDGVNDSPALAKADLGIAIGSGTDVAIEASDITLVGDDLRGVASAIKLARSTYKTILQNLFWAFGYNVALVPLAAFGKVNPTLAAAAMGASSVSVVANALRLRRTRIAQ